MNTVHDKAHRLLAGAALAFDRGAGDVLGEPGREPGVARHVHGLWAELVELGVVAEQSEAWQRSAGALLDLDSAVVRPGHCTGQKALSRLQDILGESCQPLAVGDSIEF